MVILFNYSIIGWLIIGLLQIPFSLFKDLDFVFGFLIMAMTPLTGFCTLIFLFYLLSLIWLWTKLESISLRIILRTIRIALKVIIIPLGGLFLILALLDLSDILKNVFPEEIAAGVAILGVGLILIGRKI